MDADAMKKKAHYLSFTTEFFIPIEKAERELEWHGKVAIDKEVMKMRVKGALVCHGCKEPFRTMPSLKAHLKTCVR